MSPVKSQIWCTVFCQFLCHQLLQLSCFQQHWFLRWNSVSDLVIQQLNFVNYVTRRRCDDRGKLVNAIPTGCHFWDTWSTAVAFAAARTQTRTFTFCRFAFKCEKYEVSNLHSSRVAANNVYDIRIYCPRFVVLQKFVYVWFSWVVLN